MRPRRVLEGGRARCSKFGAAVGQSHELMHESRTPRGAAISASLGERPNVRAITSAPYVRGNGISWIIPEFPGLD